MEYTNIIAAVPNGEHFDASAINEGVWMSIAHLNSIESAMATANTNVAASLNEVAAAIENVNAANEAVTASQAIIESKDAMIDSLQQQIADLKAAPAAAITQTTKEADEFEEGILVESEITKEANKLRAMRSKK